MLFSMKEQIKHIHTSSCGAIYSLGTLGAVVYYFQHAASISEGVIGIVKSLFWPALLVYKAIELLHV